MLISYLEYFCLIFILVSIILNVHIDPYFEDKSSSFTLKYRSVLFSESSLAGCTNGSATVSSEAQSPWGTPYMYCSQLELKRAQNPGTSYKWDTRELRGQTSE